MNGPKGTKRPAPDDVVQVLMTEDMARRFEERCLGLNTAGPTQLAGPLLFGPDDVPTYIIGVGHSGEDPTREMPRDPGQR